MTFNYTGHVFSVQGQGLQSMPSENVKAFLGTDSIGGDEDTKIPTTAGQAIMMISLFPDSVTFTGAADTEIVIHASTVAFGTFEEVWGNIAQPDVPSAALAGIDAAVMLSAGAALMSVGLALY